MYCIDSFVIQYNFSYKELLTHGTKLTIHIYESSYMNHTDSSHSNILLFPLLRRAVFPFKARNSVAMVTCTEPYEASLTLRQCGPD
jgi:hypothetical protein